MRIVKIIVITLILGGIAVPSISCSSETDTETMLENQAITVQRGDLVIDITAAGNLALSYTAEPAFEIGGTAQDPVTVEEVLVEEGDTVEEGQIIASLDTDSLEQAVRTAEQGVRTAEIDLEKATAIYSEITYPYTYSTFAFDVPAAIASMSDALRQVRETQEALEIGLTFEQYWEVWRQLKLAEDNLVEARARLARGGGEEMFTTGIIPVSSFWTIRAAQLDMEKAQVALDKAQDALDIAKDELGKAVVVAPFAGFITKVNVEGGDEVYKGTVVARLADPDKFEAEVMVNEMDIFQVKLGGDATVQIDAMPTLTLPAKVTHISPTATIEAGVVNYKVKVEIQSLEALMQERQQAMQEAMQDVTSGELPERLQQAIKEGSITQEQAEEMIKQMQQGQGGQQGQVPTTIPEDFQLREGLTVTVSILVEGRKDVLFVPNGAITRRGIGTYVQVLKDGVIEERTIKTGISNWQYTEVTDGLSEGEKVVVPQGTTTTPTTPRSGGSPPMFFPH